MRLLPERHDHGGDGAAESNAEADRRADRCEPHQHLSLRHLPAGARSDPHRRQGVGEAAAMNAITKMNRRSFLVGSAAATGGLSLGFHLPGGSAQAAEATPEVNAWVVIKP